MFGPADVFGFVVYERQWGGNSSVVLVWDVDASSSIP